MSSAINIPFYLFFSVLIACLTQPLRSAEGSDITLRELFVIQLNAIKCLIRQPLLDGLDHRRGAAHVHIGRTVPPFGQVEMLGEVAALAGPRGRRVAQYFGVAKIRERGSVTLDARGFAQVLRATHAVVQVYRPLAG